MRLRSITYFCNPGWPLDEEVIRSAGEFLSEAKGAFEAAGYEVQSTRLATPEFMHVVGGDRLDETPRLAEALAGSIQSVGIAYACLGPAQPEIPASYAVIPDALAASTNIFFSGVIAHSRFGLSLASVQSCAEVILRNSTVSPDGFANLRFAALANVKPGTPFFPAAYHGGGEAEFALATEAAELAVKVFKNARTVSEGQWEMASSIEEHARRLVPVGEELGQRFAIKFGGIDFSLAPFPEASRSIGTALEKLGAGKVGLHGSLAAAAILAEAVERARFPRTGFSGLMLPVLEDAVLAQRAAEGTLAVKDLLLFSAVCGTGLDTLPLPGNTAPEQIAALLYDLAALALRLDKPLTARLMPVPGKKAGDPTDFKFDYFANSRVMALEAESLPPYVVETKRFALGPRRP